MWVEKYALHLLLSNMIFPQKRLLGGWAMTDVYPLIETIKAAPANSPQQFDVV